MADISLTSVTATANPFSDVSSKDLQVTRLPVSYPLFSSFQGGDNKYSLL